MIPIEDVTQFLPTRWQPYVPLVVLAIVVSCKLVTVAVPPPAATSRWAGLYGVISRVALNLGYAVNAFQPGRSAVMVPTDVRGDVRTAVADKLGIPRESTKP